MGWHNSRWSTAPEEVSILGSMSLHVWLPGLKHSLNHRGATIGPLSMFYFPFEDRCSHYIFFCEFDHRM